MHECHRRAPSQGLRCFEMLMALISRFPQVQSGILYIGDSCLDAGREHCCGACRKAGRRCEHRYFCMAKLMGKGRCGKTAHRAKYDLLRVGLIRLVGAGPRMCPCEGCGGGKAGGTILNSNGQPVAGATGYEIDPELFGQPKQTRPRARGKERAISSGHGAVWASPAERRLQEENSARMHALVDDMRSRAGP